MFTIAPDAKGVELTNCKSIRCGIVAKIEIPLPIATG
jgi:hypothetical protein